MNGERVCSSPDLLPLASRNRDDLSLEGIATNVKLLLKLVQDHHTVTAKGLFDERKAQRFAGMMTILDDVKARLQKAQTSGTNRRRAELRRCNTDLKIHNPPREGMKKDDGMSDDKEKLKRDLNMSLAAQKRLGVMCASLGREKDIISRELTRKVQELNEMEQLVSDLKAQNERLSAKIHASVALQKENDIIKVDEVNASILRDKNKELYDQLVKSLEGYKSMKRRVQEAKDEKEEMQATMEDVGDEIQVGIEKIHSLRQCLADSDCGEDNVVSLYHVLKKVEDRVSKYRKEGRQ